MQTYLPYCFLDINNMKKWEKPELIVLVRTNAEESVLGSCKTGNLTGPEGARCQKKFAPIPCEAKTHS
jgi:hypothetical protein